MQKRIQQVNQYIDKATLEKEKASEKICQLSCLLQHMSFYQKNPSKKDAIKDMLLKEYQLVLPLLKEKKEDFSPLIGEVMIEHSI